MKRTIFSCFICAVMLFIYSCSFNKGIEPVGSEFVISYVTDDIVEGSNGNLDRGEYLYTLYIQSGSKKSDNVIAINIVSADTIKDRVIEKTVFSMNYNEDILEVKGSLVFDSENLSEEELRKFHPFITGVTVTISDLSELSFEFKN